MILTVSLGTENKIKNFEYFLTTNNISYNKQKGFPFHTDFFILNSKDNNKVYDWLKENINEKSSI